MPIEITIPRLGWNMEEGVFVGWLKHDGDTVRAGESLFTLEGEKATEDIECLDSGILLIPPTAPNPGDKVAVGVVIGYLLKLGETVGWVESGRPTREVSSLAVRANKVGLEDSAHPTAAPSNAPAPATVSEVLCVAKAASPRARRVARELGVDWTKLKGTGRSGRIRECDIRAAAAGVKHAAHRTQYAVPLTSTRQTIAAGLLATAHSVVPVTLTTTADATNLVNLRGQFKSTADVVPSYTDFFIKLAAGALRQHPLLNAWWANDEIVVSKDIHISIAVDTDAGLLVPVVRDVPGLSMRQLAAVSRDLINRARQGK